MRGRMMRDSDLLTACMIYSRELCTGSVTHVRIVKTPGGLPDAETRLGVVAMATTLILRQIRFQSLRAFRHKSMHA